MSEEQKAIKRLENATTNYSLDSEDLHYAKILYYLIINLQKENQKLKKQLEYLRSGEYLNQLKFERNMLEDIVQNSEISKEDKEFIDMTHRNTELLEENQELKDRIDKAVEYTEEHRIKNPYHYEYNCFMGNARASDLLEILKGDKE